jgi:hypothetical protein
MTTIPDIPTPHEDTAQTLRLDLKRMTQNVRGLVLLTAPQRRKLVVSGHVDDDFLRRMGLLIDAHPDIASMTQITSDDIRDHLSFHGAYLGVGEEMILNGRKIVDTLTADRASIGQKALVALKIARSINARIGGESLVPHLEAIDRDFSRGRYKRAKKPDAEVLAAKKKEVTKPFEAGQ